MTNEVSQIQITIQRLSDETSFVFFVDEKITVGDLKKEIRTHFPPKFAQGCRLIYKGKVLHSKRKLKYYGLTANLAPPHVFGNTNISMDDTKNWKSDSSSSSSEESN